MPLIMRGTGLTIENVVDVARHGKKIELAPEAIEASRRVAGASSNLEFDLVTGERGHRDALVRDSIRLGMPRRTWARSLIRSICTRRRF